ncbi:MAG: hypothetical protein BWY87_00306 [Deltaproteobacteria bacterium ADurb.Bin510]|nr:MAG: hypothetical protein BWY87_00306 [Deltaproteobacteria bacterium ADurb.Bin510]
MAINEDRLFTIVLLVVMLTFIGFHKAQAAEPWEAGMKIGAYSNVYHSVDDEDGDWYVSPLLAYSNATKPKKGLAWTIQGVLDGYVYRDEHDLNSVALTLTPGLWYAPDRSTQMRVQPFAQIKAVNDSDQSASAYGGSVSLDHQWSKTFGSGVYLRYLDSHAREHVYSAEESALGASLDLNLTSKWYGSCWYEYAHGSNYQSMTVAVPAANAWGWNLGYAGIYPFREYNSQTVTILLTGKQDTQSLGLRSGYAWTPRILTELAYVHRKADSDWGDVSSDEVSCGVYLRF